MAFDKGVLKLEIIAPDKVDVGQEFEYVVKYKNNGSITLNSPEMYFEYPNGAIIEESDSRVKKVGSDDLGGNIYPGQERTMKFKARLLGKEGETKDAKVRVNFQPQDLKIRNEAESSFTIILDKLPLDLTLDIPQKSGAGKAVTIRVSYTSNVSYPLKDLSCLMEYPADFQFSYAKPNGIDNKQWDEPILNESDSKKIEIGGILNGEPQDQKVFKAKLGVWQDGNFIVLKEAIRGVAMVAPSVRFTEKINNQEGYNINMGDRLHYEIYFSNAGDEELKDQALIIKLEGSSLDYNSIKALEGVYQKGDNSLIWDGNQLPELQSLKPGEEGKIEFWISTNKDDMMKNSSDKNPFVKTKITLGQIKQEFLNKVNTKLIAIQNLYTDSRYFSDSGPNPVKAGTKTTYTVEWKVKNLYNDVSNAKVMTILPSGLRFNQENYKVPEGTKLSFDEGTRQLTWEIGSLPAGTGIISSEKICAFQLSIEPQTTDTDILLIGSSQLSGSDLWTNNNVSISTDPIYSK
ncbi:MAG: hypothetical protein PHW52_04660 [Candidatus Pacebacteria bacterium]|nr:hypothetical protein [Candidatus Paceibacterota bacterium]